MDIRNEGVGAVFSYEKGDQSFFQICNFCLPKYVVLYPRINPHPVEKSKIVSVWNVILHAPFKKLCHSTNFSATCIKK